MYGLSVTTILQIGLFLLKVTNALLANLEQKRLIDIGMKKQVAADLAALQVSLDITKEVNEYVEKLSDSDLDDVLINGIDEHPGTS